MITVFTDTKRDISHDTKRGYWPVQTNHVFYDIFLSVYGYMWKRQFRMTEYDYSCLPEISLFKINIQFV